MLSIGYATLHLSLPFTSCALETALLLPPLQLAKCKLPSPRRALAIKIHRAAFSFKLNFLGLIILDNRLPLPIGC